MRNFLATLVYYVIRILVFLSFYFPLYYIIIWEGLLDFIWNDYAKEWEAAKLPVTAFLSYILAFQWKMKTNIWPKIATLIEKKI